MVHNGAFKLYNVGKDTPIDVTEAFTVTRPLQSNVAEDVPLRTGGQILCTIKKCFAVRSPRDMDHQTLYVAMSKAFPCGEETSRNHLDDGITKQVLPVFAWRHWSSALVKGLRSGPPPCLFPRETCPATIPQWTLEPGDSTKPNSSQSYR